MSKSIQDLCVWMHKLERHWEFPKGNDIACIVYADKTFQLLAPSGDSENPVPFFSASDVDDYVDINDLCYMSAIHFTEKYQITNPLNQHTLGFDEELQHARENVMVEAHDLANKKYNLNSYICPTCSFVNQATDNYCKRCKSMLP